MSQQKNKYAKIDEYNGKIPQEEDKCSEVQEDTKAVTLNIPKSKKSTTKDIQNLCANLMKPHKIRKVTKLPKLYMYFSQSSEHYWWNRKIVKQKEFMKKQNAGESKFMHN